MIDGLEKKANFTNSTEPPSLKRALKEEIVKRSGSLSSKAIFQYSLNRNEVTAHRLQKQYPTIIDTNLRNQEVVSPAVGSPPASANVPQATVATRQVPINSFKSKSEDLCVRKIPFGQCSTRRTRPSSDQVFPGNYNIY